MVADPRQQRDRLTGHDMLAGAGEYSLLGAVLFPAHRIFPRAVIRRNDALARGSAVLAPQIKPLTVAADTDAGDVLRRNAGLFQNAADHGAVRLPHLLHVALNIVRLRRQHGGGHAADCDFLAGAAEKRRFGGSAAVVQTDIIMHNRSSFPLCRIPRHSREKVPAKPGARKCASAGSAGAAIIYIVSQFRCAVKEIFPQRLSVTAASYSLTVLSQLWPTGTFLLIQ